MTTLSKLAVRRLSKLADHMDALPQNAWKHFNMDSWFSNLRGKPATEANLLQCGTSACAAGWAATIPAFQRAGFRWNAVSNYFTVHPDVFFDTVGSGDDPFSWWDCRTPKQWAKQCRKFIRENS